MLASGKNTSRMLGAWFIPLRVLLLLLVIRQDCRVRAKTGTFFTTDTINNKWLPTGIIVSHNGVATNAQCQDKCSVDPDCNGYAINAFEKKCVLYRVKLGGTKPVQYIGYKLFILKRTEEDGYFVYGTEYIRLMIERKTAINASIKCAEDGGRLASVKKPQLNDMLHGMIEKHNIWTAFIGVSDLQQEGTWMYADGTPVTYTNWDWNGMWPRDDLDCAVITNSVDKTWRHANCWQPDYYFCQIPMF